MRKVYSSLFIAIFFFFGTTSLAQVSAYTLSQSSGLFAHNNISIDKLLAKADVAFASSTNREWNNMMITEVATIDVGPTALIFPAFVCPTNNVALQTTITNFGTDPLDFSLNPITVNVNVTGAGTGTLTGASPATGTLAPGATLDIALTPNFNFAAGGTYNFVVTTTVAGDGDATNNVLNYSRFVLSSPVAPVFTPASPAVCAGSVIPISVPASVATFTSSTAITIPAGAPANDLAGIANPYPVNLSVSGIPAGAVVKSVTINGIVHTFPGDLDILLQSPTGIDVVLMSDAGGNVDATGQNYTFDDAATGLLADLTLNATGTYRPTNYGTPDTWTAPGPGSISQATPTLSSFTGDFNGVWKLYVVDDTDSDVGSISSWSITFEVPTAVWTPIAGLFTNPAGTVAYVAGTPLKTIYAKPTATTIYSVTNTIGTCTAAPVNVTVLVNPLPTISVAPNNQCGPVALTATGNSNTYSWSPAAGLNTTTGATVTANPTVNTTYMVVGTLTSTGCTNSASVTVNATPAAPVVTPTSISLCPGSTTQLSSPSAVKWSPVTGLFTDPAATVPYVANALASTVYAKPTTTTTYAVTTSTATCTSPATNVVVTVLQPITVTTQPATQTVCQGANITFSIVVGGTSPTYQWQISTNGGGTYNNIPGANSASLVLPNVATTMSGNRYRVIVTNSCTTVTSNAATLTVNASTAVTATPLTNRICLSDTLITLTGTPIGGFWTGPGISGNTFLPSSTSVGTYNLTYSYVNTLGCTTSSTITAKVEDCPERLISLRDNAVVVYPNPSNGLFNIKINSVLYNYIGMKVYTAGGLLLREQVFNGLVYGRVIQIDLSNLPSGTYMVKFFYDAGSLGSDKSFKVVIGR